MSQLHPYSGKREDHLMAPPDPAPPVVERRLQFAEAEVERLRGILRNQEQALRVAGKVLSPYLNRL